MKITLNPNEEHVKRIDRLLEENLKKYGKRFCPCTIIRDDDHVCPCKEFIESETKGECHCGKYIKTEVWGDKHSKLLTYTL